MKGNLCFDTNTNTFLITDGVACFPPSAIPAGRTVKTRGAYSSTVIPSLDFETYSEAGYVVNTQSQKNGVKKVVKGIGSGSKGGLAVVGTPVYVEHESAEILSLAYDLKDGLGPRLWIPCAPPPTDLLEHVKAGGMLEAFNFTFEWYVWNMIAVRKLGWPPLQLEQGVCVMSRARRCALPGKLGKAAEVLGVEGKLDGGVSVMRKLSRPQTTTKSRSDIRIRPDCAPADYQALYKYNVQDVIAEDAVAARLPDLTPNERAVWLLDQRINARGVQLDLKALNNAIALYREVEKKLTIELVVATDGAVGSVNENTKFVEWLNSVGIKTASIDAESVASLLKSIESGALSGFKGSSAHTALRIREALASANIKKLFTLKNQVSSDGRLRDQYMYCGAAQTGRFSSGGVQLQNLTSKGPVSAHCPSCGQYSGQGAAPLGVEDECIACGGEVLEVEWSARPMSAAKQDLSLKFDDFKLRWPEVVATLAGCLRGMFVPKSGCRFICADFSAIEAVVLACIAECEWRIDVFRTHGKIYEMSAAAITGKTLDDYLAYKKQHGHHHPDRKKIGKVAELASGYGGWINAWRNFGAEGSDEYIKSLILAWRAASPEIEELWGGQFRQVGSKPWDAVPQLFGVEGAAINSIRNPGVYYDIGPVSFITHNDVMYCKLPSGRLLYYHSPILTPVEDKLKRGPAVSITFMRWNTNPQMGPLGWVRTETYGGRLVENITQAIAADIQTEAMLRVEAAGYNIVMHTHDEIVVEAAEGFGSLEHVAEHMSIPPVWAAGWPIKADGWVDYFYQKD